MTIVNEVIKQALDSLPYEKCRPPAKAKAKTYVSWFQVERSTGYQAGNRPLRTVYLMQIDIYSKIPLTDQTDRVIQALKAAGLKIDHCAAEDYEEDTGYHHLPIRCWWAQQTITRSDT